MPVAIPSSCGRHALCLSGNAGPADCALRAICTCGTLARYDRGVEILSQGQSCARLALILSGVAKISTISADGVEHVLHLLEAGQILGDPSTIQSAISWSAVSEVELRWLTPKSLLAACRENAEIQLELMAVLSRQMQQHYLFSQALRERNTVQRIAYWLMTQLPAEHATGDHIQFRILLSRRDLASLLDMTVESLCRVLRQLGESGAIELKASDLVLLRDPEKLSQIAKMPEELALTGQCQLARVAVSMNLGQPDGQSAVGRGGAIARSKHSARTAQGMGRRRQSDNRHYGHADTSFPAS